MTNINTELCRLAFKYGTDKCKDIKHPYTPFYFNLLNEKRESVKKVLELGIGMHDGASLRMWKEFFPNATIYGIDIVEERLIQDERIKTFLCDGRDEEQLKKLINEIGSDIDLFIDDGSHRWEDQINTCKLLKPLIKDALYIIEDVRFPDTIKRKLPQYLVEKAVLVDTKYRDDGIVVIK